MHSTTVDTGGSGRSVSSIAPFPYSAYVACNHKGCLSQSFALREHLAQCILKRTLEDQNFDLINGTCITRKTPLRVNVLARELWIAPHISWISRKARRDPGSIC